MEGHFKGIDYSGVLTCELDTFELHIVPQRQDTMCYSSEQSGSGILLNRNTRERLVPTQPFRRSVEGVLLGLVERQAVHAVRVGVCEDTARDSAKGSWYFRPCAADFIANTFLRLKYTRHLTTLS